jgi:hypothetical protein
MEDGGIGEIIRTYCVAYSTTVISEVREAELSSCYLTGRR